MTPKRSEVPVTPLGRKPVEPQTPAGLIAAGSLADRNMVIGKGLQRFVMLHLARHLSRLSLTRPCPRYAIVQGAPGCGKTSSIEKLVTDAGCDLINMSASDLTSPYAGGATEKLDQVEQQARECSARTGRPVAVKIDDLDLSIASQHDNVEYEVNSQLLTHYLQFVADNVARWAMADQRTIAFFITINDASGFRPSMFRAGRAEFFTHTVSNEDKVAIVAAMLGIRNQAEVRRLIGELPDAPVAFFATLKAHAADEDLARLMTEHGTDWTRIAAETANLGTGTDWARLRVLARTLSTGGGRFLNDPAR